MCFRKKQLTGRSSCGQAWQCLGGRNKYLFYFYEVSHCEQNQRKQFKFNKKQYLCPETMMDNKPNALPCSQCLCYWSGTHREGCTIHSITISQNKQSDFGGKEYILSPESREKRILQIKSRSRALEVKTMRKSLKEKAKLSLFRLYKKHRDWKPESALRES